MTEPILRVAIGYSPGRDLVVHYFVQSGGISFPDMQVLCESHDLNWMLMLDGGGSAGLIDKPHGSGVIGNNVRKLPSTFVFLAEQSVPTSWT